MEEVLDGRGRPYDRRRPVRVTAPRTTQDRAAFSRDLAAVPCPDAERIAPVADNRTTQVAAALYGAFPAAAARRLRRKRAVRSTPAHGSWLTIAAVDLGLLSRQGARRRLPDIATLTAGTTARARDRNARTRTIDRRFTTPDASIKLPRLYPSVGAWRRTRL